MGKGMTEQAEATVEERALSAFETWTRGLAGDAKAVATALVQTQASEPASEPARVALAAGLNYLIKSLDLIDDGIEGLGYLDDALILRLSVAAAVRLGAADEDLIEMAKDTGLIREALGDLFPRLERYAGSLSELTVRGRSALEIVREATQQEELVAELRSWASRYEPPAFLKDEKSLVTLHAFLDTKLPARTP